MYVSRCVDRCRRGCRALSIACWCATPASAPTPSSCSSTRSYATPATTAVWCRSCAASGTVRAERRHVRAAADVTTVRQWLLMSQCVVNVAGADDVDVCTDGNAADVTGRCDGSATDVMGRCDGSAADVTVFADTTLLLTVNRCTPTTCPL